MSLPPAVHAMGSNLSPGMRISEAVTIDRLNAIMDAIRALARVDNVTAGPYLKATASGGKTVLSLARAPRSGGGGTAATVRPFDATTINPIDGIVRFYPGTLNGILPDNWADSFAYTPGSTNYVYLAAEANGGAVLRHELAIAATPPAPIAVTQGYPPVEFSVLIGIISGDAWLRVAGPSSVTAQSREVLRTVKPSYAPGEFPFNLFYSWEVSS